MNTISDTILRRIRAKQRGWVFTPKDFLDLATRGAVDNILSRLVKRGAIRRIDKGIYDFPKSSPIIANSQTIHRKSALKTKKTPPLSSRDGVFD